MRDSALKRLNRFTERDSLREERRQERQMELREAVDNLRGSLAARGYVTEGGWIPSPGNLTISRALLDLVTPYMNEETDIIEARVLALVGGVAWNLASVPEVGKEEREELRRVLTADTATRLDLLLRHMCKRKRDLFPADRRIISQTRVNQQSDGSFFFRAAAVT